MSTDKIDLVRTLLSIIACENMSDRYKVNAVEDVLRSELKAYLVYDRGLVDRETEVKT